MYGPIAIPEEGLEEVWLTLLALNETFAERWTLIGAYMVALHAWGVGQAPPRRSDEPDVLMDVRLPEPTASAVADRLVEIGWEPEPGRNGTIHRFHRGRLALDLFGPENLGYRTSERRRIQSSRLLEVPGGRQALDRSERQPILVGGKEGWVPLPTLLAAVLLKSRAYFKRNDALTREADLKDLAFLISLATASIDPLQWDQELVGRQRQWLRNVSEPLIASRPAWSVVDRPDRAQRFLNIVLDGAGAPARRAKT